jgi:hypothetical protein
MNVQKKGGLAAALLFYSSRLEAQITRKKLESAAPRVARYRSDSQVDEVV